MMFMSLVDVILSRRSIRHYEQKEIPKDVVDQILKQVGKLHQLLIGNRGTLLS
jgi:hypothetical protein